MRRLGWTLVETLVSVGILGVLLSLILPAVQQVRESAARTKCLNRLRQLGVGLHAYESVNGRLPPRRRDRLGTGTPEAALGWMALILPQIGEDALYASATQACARDPNPMHNPPHAGLATGVADYICPDDGRAAPMTDMWGRTVAFTSYVGVYGAYLRGHLRLTPGAFGCRMTDIKDGTSSTLLVGERPPPDSLQAGWWYPIYAFDSKGRIGPNHYLPFGNIVLDVGDQDCPSSLHFFGPGRLDNPCDRYHFWSLHPGGGNWLFADASARFLSYSANPLMPALATRDGGEVVTVPD